MIQHISVCIDQLIKNINSVMFIQDSCFPAKTPNKTQPNVHVLSLQ